MSEFDPKPLENIPFDEQQIEILRRGFESGGITARFDPKKNQVVVTYIVTDSKGKIVKRKRTETGDNAAIIMGIQEEVMKQKGKK